MILCLEDLSIGVNGVLKSPTMSVLLLIPLFMSINDCFMYVGTPMLGAYMFTRFMSYRFIDPSVIM